MSITAVNTAAPRQLATRIEALKRNLKGQVFLPLDDGYEAARRIWNAMIDKHPALIVRCTGLADVIASVHFARKNNLTASVRGGGHNVAGTSLCDGLVIDLSSMKSVHVNPAARTVRVGGGATWQDVNHELQVFGLAAAGGDCDGGPGSHTSRYAGFSYL